jgi:type III pantothenate kinase
LPIGDSTVTAIEAGLYWGTFGAVRELVQRIADRQSGTPDVFVTGGAAAALAEGLAEHTRLVVQHVPHLVLAGVALVAEG